MAFIVALVGAFTTARADDLSFGEPNTQIMATINVPQPGAHSSEPFPGANVVIYGPDQMRWTLQRSRLLKGIPPGEYTVEPGDVWWEGERYVALPGRTSFTLDYGDNFVLPLTYENAADVGVHGDPVRQHVRPGARSYHLDCVAGDDGAVGLGPESAWRSLGRLSGLVLEPGDRLLLRRGCSWVGPLRVPWQGSAEWPVVVGAYGEGPLPAIHDSSLNHVDITGSHVIIEHLQAFTSAGSVPVEARCEDQPVAWRTGFTLQHGAHHVTIRHSLSYGNTAGIHVTRGASHNRLVNNELRDNVIMSVNTDNGGQDDSGAWGLVLNGTDNVVAYNRFSGNNAWCSYDFGQEGASIEVYEAQRNLIHHNVSIGDTTFTELGSSDYRDAEDNVFAYNVYVSHRRNSEFLVLRGAGAHFGPTPGTKAFHNTVYLTHPEETQGVVCYSGCGPHILELRNNIIWAEWKGIYVDQPIAESHNLFWRSDGRPLLQFFGTGNAMSSDSIIANPLFRNPDENDFRLQQNSPAIQGGVRTSVSRLFERDVTGVLIDAGATPDMGAHRAN